MFQIALLSIMKFTLVNNPAVSLETASGYSVVMEFVRSLLNKNHHVYFNDLLSSPKLLQEIQIEGTYTCLTVRAGRLAAILA